MTLQQLNQRVQDEADARFGDTVEHLLFLLDYQRRLKEVAVKCYCVDLMYTQHDRMCGYCRDEDEEFRMMEDFTKRIKTTLVSGYDLGGF